MGKYLKLFSNQTEYNTFMSEAGNTNFEYITPSVYLVKDEDVVYNKHIFPLMLNLMTYERNYEDDEIISYSFTIENDNNNFLKEAFGNLTSLFKLTNEEKEWMNENEGHLASTLIRDITNYPLYINQTQIKEIFRYYRYENNNMVPEYCWQYIGINDDDNYSIIRELCKIIGKTFNEALIQDYDFRFGPYGISLNLNLYKKMPMINFTCNDSYSNIDREYQCELGMTWRQFINSDYNPYYSNGKDRHFGVTSDTGRDSGYVWFNLYDDNYNQIDNSTEIILDGNTPPIVDLDSYPIDGERYIA